MSLNWYSYPNLPFPMNSIQIGNSFQLINLIPDNFLWWTFTSPPYWKARDYGTIPQIFDGDPNCDHLWYPYMRKGTTGGIRSKKVQIKDEANFQIVHDQEQAICLKCSAIRCEYGQEPFLLNHKFETSEGEIEIKGYIHHSVELFHKILTKTRLDGSLWLNIGDVYSTQGGQNLNTSNDFSQYSSIKLGSSNRMMGVPLIKSDEFPAKSLVLSPFRIAIDLEDKYGYIVRNMIIWNKLNGMPQSAKDRCTQNFEPILFIVKNNKTLYWVNERTLEMSIKHPKGINGEEGIDWKWSVCLDCIEKLEEENSDEITKQFLKTTNHIFDQYDNNIELLVDILPRLSEDRLSELNFTSICDKKSCEHGKTKLSLWKGYDYYYEQVLEKLISKNAKTKQSRNKFKEIQKKSGTYSGFLYNALNYAGKNKRAVWEVMTANSKQKHSATFNVELLQDPIKMGVPPYYCKKCGLPRVRVYEYNKIDPIEIYTGKAVKDYQITKAQNPSDSKRRILESMRKVRTLKGLSNCICDQPEYIKGFGFDPFMGIGNSAKALLLNHLEYIGFDLKQDYVNIANENLQPLKVKKLEDFFTKPIWK